MWFQMFLFAKVSPAEYEQIPLFLRLTISSLLVLIIRWGIRTSRIILVWIIIELNLLLFLPLFVFRSGRFRGVRGLKFFFVQRVGGILLLRCMLIVSHTRSWVLLIIARLRVLLKTGGFPFQQWLIKLSTEIRWDGLLILLTIQKAIPLYILSVFNRGFLIPLITLRWIILRVSGLVIKHLKKIFVLSSVFFLGALIVSTSLRGWGWKPLLLIYFGVFASFSFILGGENTGSGGSPRANSADSNSRWFLVILFLSGIPPFPAFWIKVEVVRGMMASQELLQRILFVFCGGVFMYIYVSLISWFVLLSTRLKTRNRKNKIGTMGAVAPVFLLWVLV